jgi:hypothetical protein
MADSKLFGAFYTPPAPCHPYCTWRLGTLTRSVSESIKPFPGLHFGLVSEVSFLTVRRITYWPLFTCHPPPATYSPARSRHGQPFDLVPAAAELALFRINDDESIGINWLAPNN